eukprot:6209617-Pleurochrysis_carterae.AAC.3
MPSSPATSAARRGGTLGAWSEPRIEAPWVRTHRWRLCSTNCRCFAAHRKPTNAGARPFMQRSPCSLSPLLSPPPSPQRLPLCRSPKRCQACVRAQMHKLAREALRPSCFGAPTEAPLSRTGAEKPGGGRFVPYFRGEGVQLRFAGPCLRELLPRRQHGRRLIL